MRILIPLFCLACVLQAQTRPSWAFLTPDPDQPAVEEKTGPVHIPDSTKTYTAKEVDDLTHPPDWFPNEHAPAPEVITGGPGTTALACGACHLMRGQGHPESADVAGMPVEYIVRQMADFKNNLRIDPARMNMIASTLSEDDARKAAVWLSALKPTVWVKVTESKTVPKSYVSTKGRMRLPLPGGGTEALGNRIIELPLDQARAQSRDPHSGFIAYVPVGSVAKGKKLVANGASGRSISCTICHGDDLKGIGDVPRIAGLHPIYITRQLYKFKSDDYTGTSAALMKKVVAKLTDEDILAISAYAASLEP